MSRTSKRDRDAVQVGDVFHRLTVVGPYSTREDGQAVFPCRCACGGERLVLFRSLGQTKSCGCLQKEVTRARRQITPGRTQTRRENRIWQNYRLTLDQWEVLYDQQLGRCAVCLVPLAEVVKVCVDHDHTTNRVRGLLCHGCNVAIGHLRDDPELIRRAADYVERLRLISVPDAVLSATVLLSG